MTVITHSEKCVGCLICQLTCSFTFTKSFNPLQSRIVIQRVDDGWKISFTDECNNCGLCTKYCMYEALESEKES